MKFFLAIAAAALAVVNAADCDLIKLAPLLTDANVLQCGKDTGFKPPTPPDATILPKLCDNKSCKAALATLKGLGLGDCTALGVKLESELTGPIEAYCAKASPAPSPATPTTGTPTTGTPTTGTPGVTPAPATTKPGC